MMAKLEDDFAELRKLFAADEGVDEETRADNEQQIQEWEQSVRTHELMAEWQEHPISKSISIRAEETYVECATTLWRNRSLTDAQRAALWAKQDAAQFILTLTEKDPKGVIARIHKQVKSAIDAVS